VSPILAFFFSAILFVHANEQPDTRPAIIFVPGYYGSMLKKAGTSTRVFLSASEVIFGGRPLSLAQKELLTPEGYDDLEVDGVMEGIPIVPLLYTYDVYGEILRELRKNPAVQVVPFAYDWRRDLVAAAGQLAQKIAELKAQGVSHIDIAAHSMGGLVTAYFLEYGAQEMDGAVADWRGARDVGKVVFFGVPFRGVLSPFRNMNRGTCLARNCKFFPAQTVASFPASYQLLSFADNEQVRRDGTRIPLEIENLDMWKRHRAGLFGGKDVPEPVRVLRETFTRDQLVRAKRFSAMLHAGVDAPGALKVLNVIGEGTKTLNAVFLDQGRFIFDADRPARFKLA
jgi:pimeloyl-ACP methyl ester carboxylesterase